MEKFMFWDTGNPWAMSSVHFMAAVNLRIKGDGVGNPLDFCTCETQSFRTFLERSV